MNYERKYWWKLFQRGVNNSRRCISFGVALIFHVHLLNSIFCLFPAFIIIFFLHYSFFIFAVASFPTSSSSSSSSSSSPCAFYGSLAVVFLLIFVEEGEIVELWGRRRLGRSPGRPRHPPGRFMTRRPTLRAPPASTGLLRSPPVSSGLLRSPRASSGLLRSPRASFALLHSVSISFGLLGVGGGWEQEGGWGRRKGKGGRMKRRRKKEEEEEGGGFSGLEPSALERNTQKANGLSHVIKMQSNEPLGLLF